MTAKSEEELDHVLWVTILSCLHVDLDPRKDGFLPGRTRLMG